MWMSTLLTWIEMRLMYFPFSITFNPILVWFEHLLRQRNNVWLHAQFQSHFGLIWTKLTVPLAPMPMAFQSHFGLIWTQERALRERSQFQISIPFWSDLNYPYGFQKLSSVSRFQSHFGLIWTCYLQSVLANSMHISIPFWSDLNWVHKLPKGLQAFWFQSHFGLIWTRIRASAYEKMGLNFNPILVWFEPLRLRDADSERDKFQSHFGLIWTYRVRAKVDLPELFQSHFGLIWTRAEQCLRYCKQLNFNPILVWFEQEEREEVTALFELISIPFWSDLNGNILLYIFLVSKLFQSHFGLIWTLMDICDIYLLTSRFQSHFGLIWTKIKSYHFW